MSKTLYLECHSGISGDMTVAALLDLGADPRVLQQVLDSVPVKGFSIQISRVKKAGIDCCDFMVKLEQENHDHDMAYLHGHDHPQLHEHIHTHDHEHEQEHSHEHDHEHEQERSHEHFHEHEQEHSHEHFHEHDQEPHHTHEHGYPYEHETGHSHGHEHPDEHTHEHRHLPEILQILDAVKMTDSARNLAKKIFHILAEAEARAHAVPLEEVHFHEVGAIDSIVDIIAVSVCLDNLDIQNVIIPRLCEGTGTVRCQHGVLPVPVPAVSHIAAAYGLPLEFMEIPGEFVTPTGAAIAAAIKTSEVLPKPLHIEKIGIGAGKRTYERPSMLRAMLIQPVSRSEDCIYKLESDIDDCSGEALGYVMNRLLAAGARDVHYIPVYMKKCRPAYQLNVICTEDKIPALEEIIFRETTTIGIRRQKMERTILKREMHTVNTVYGEALVKVCQIGDTRRAYPEYDSVLSLCQATGASYQAVYRAAAEAGDSML